MRRGMGLLLAIALLLALVPAVLAGGWAVITLDEPPGEVRAGEPWTVGFTVLQHGRTPVHQLDANSPVEPVLVARNLDDGRRVEAQATRGQEVGHFTIEVTFPTEGAWEWTIFPAPLAGETMFEPLTVLPALGAAAEPVVEPAAPVIAPAEEPEVAAPVVQPAVQPVAGAPDMAGGGRARRWSCRCGQAGCRVVDFGSGVVWSFVLDDDRQSNSCCFVCHPLSDRHHNTGQARPRPIPGQGLHHMPPA